MSTTQCSLYSAMISPQIAGYLFFASIIELGSSGSIWQTMDSRQRYCLAWEPHADWRLFAIALGEAGLFTSQFVRFPGYSGFLATSQRIRMRLQSQLMEVKYPNLRNLL